MDKVHTGGCYCGHIRYAITGPVERAGICHCENCRKAVGAQSVAWILLKKIHFRMDKGDLSRYRTDTGAWRGFCPHCGTSISYESDRRADEIDITTGSLDEPDDFPPQWDAYAEEKISWVHTVK